MQGGIDLLFYGDSLTELWRGTAWGYNSRLGGGIPAVFSHYFGQYRSVVCGSGGVSLKPASRNASQNDSVVQCV